MFKLLLALSGFSLVFFGTCSLGLSIWSSSLVGCLISVAILAHGVVELKARKRLLDTNSSRGAQVLIWNQLILAVSVSLYAIWQIWITDPESLRAAMESPLVAEVLALYPPDQLIVIDAWLPRIVTGFYLLVIVVVWLGCGATAAYYRSASRKLLREI